MNIPEVAPLKELPARAGLVKSCRCWIISSGAYRLRFARARAAEALHRQEGAAAQYI